jgi:transcriptional regulator with XRE-family HTH domain
MTKILFIGGLSLKHWGEIERRRGNPTLTSLENLAATLKVSIVQLFGYESERLSPEQVTHGTWIMHKSRVKTPL